MGGIGDDKLAVCDQCHYAFCKNCLEAFHSQTMCRKEYLIKEIEAQKLKEYEKFKLQQQETFEKNQEKEKTLLNRIHQAKEKEKIFLGKNISIQDYQQLVIKLSEQDSILEEVLTAEKIGSLQTQRCPKCHIHIEKNGGCSHMFCTHCRQHFIWGRTGAKRMNNVLPFSTELNQDSMELESVKEELYKVTNIGLKQSIHYLEKVFFILVEKSGEDETDSDETKISFDNQSLIGFAILNRVKQCPNKYCGKNNVKIGQDNWMVCSACHKEYCFLCERSFNGGQHFEKKCSRYTSVLNK